VFYELFDGGAASSKLLLLSLSCPQTLLYTGQGVASWLVWKNKDGESERVRMATV